MSLSRSAKPDVVVEQARRAVQEGRQVFTPVLAAPARSRGGAAVVGWGEVIEAVEALGWVLEHWAVAQDVKGRALAYPCFRRRQWPQPSA